MNKKMSLNLIVCSLAVLFIWLGLFGNVVSMVFGGVAYFSLSLFFIILIILVNYRKTVIAISHPYFLSFVLLVFFSFLIITFSEIWLPANSSMFGISVSAYSYNMFLNLPMWVSSFLVLIFTDENEKKQIVDLLFYVFLYNLIVSFVALNIDPSFAKNSSAGLIKENMIVFRYLGAMGYELTYTTSLLLPVFLFLAKTYKKRWLLLFLMGILFVISSQFLIAIMASIFGVFLYCFINIKKKNVRVVLGTMFFIAFVAIICNLSLLGNILINASQNTQFEELSIRLRQIGKLFVYGDGSGDSLVRIEMYSTSFLNCIRSPLLGNFIFNPFFQISGHSMILDFWSAFGFFPITILLLSLIFILSRLAGLSGDSKKCGVCTVTAFIFIGLFNQVFVSSLILLGVVFFLPAAAETAYFYRGKVK